MITASFTKDMYIFSTTSLPQCADPLPSYPDCFPLWDFPPENVVVVAIFSRDVVVGDHQERCFINVKTRLQTITVCKNTQLPFFTAIKPSDII